MSKDLVYTEATVAELMVACQEDIQAKMRRKELGPCLCLFLLAFRDNGEAWEAVYQIYYPLVRHWVYRKSGGEAQPDGIETLVQGCFTRFWRTISQKKEQFREKFPHIGAVLRYLQMCANAEVIDDGRKRTTERETIEKLKTFEVVESSDEWKKMGEDDSALDSQITAVSNWVKENVTDVQELKVLQLVYSSGLTPKQIANDPSHGFSSAKDVYRVQERLIKRMRRQLGDG